MSQRPLTIPPARWLGVELPSVAENLAVDEALLAETHETAPSEAVVRTWMASVPTVVLGSSSRLADEVNLDACRTLGVEVIRRPSGGLSVVLGPGCLMWSVIVPIPDPPPPIDAIHAGVLEPLCRTLSAAGRPVARKGSSDLAIEVAGTVKKVSGNALRVRRGAVLYHGTLLDDFDLALISAVLKHPPREPDYRSRREHGAFVANLGLGRETLEAAVRRAFDAVEHRPDWPTDRVAELLQTRYRDSAWTMRLG